MKNYTSNEDFKKALNRDIDWFKKALSDSYTNLDTYLKAKIDIGEVVLLKNSLDKGIVKSFGLDVRPDKQNVENSDRVIYVYVITVKGEVKVEMNDIVIYSDAARLLYAKQVVVKTEWTQEYQPKVDKDEIPF